MYQNYVQNGFPMQEKILDGFIIHLWSYFQFHILENFRKNVMGSSMKYKILENLNFQMFKFVPVT